MIVVTGASGFIGKYLVSYFNDHDQLVIPTMGDISYPDFDEHLPKNNVRAVVHCAAKLMIDNHDPADYYRVNALGTYHVLEYCRKVKAKMIYLMTHSDMNAANRVYIDETMPRCFKASSSGISSLAFITSKIAGADLVDAYSRSGLVEGVTLRLANIRGVGSQDTKYGCVFHQFIQKAMRSEPIELWGKLQTLRDLIYIKDIVNAIVKAIDYGRPGQTYNIGSGKGLTIEEEAKAIIDVFSPVGNPSQIVYRPEIDEVRTHSCIFTIEKAKWEMEWNPVFSYHEAMSDMKRIMNRGGKLWQ